MKRSILLGVVVVIASVFVLDEVSAVAPLTEKQEFMYGAFRMPDTPPRHGEVPARLASLPRDRSPLPANVWLRFQIFGGGRYKSWSAQMQIDDAGNIYLVTHLGDATPGKVTRPAWPAQPSQKLDQTVLEQVRTRTAAMAKGPPYCGHEGLDYAPTFVLTVRADGKESEHIFEALENDTIRHLRRIVSFAYETPLPKAQEKRKPRKDK